MDVLFVLQTELFYDCRGKNKSEAFMNLKVQDENKNYHSVLKWDQELLYYSVLQGYWTPPPCQSAPRISETLTIIGSV